VLHGLAERCPPKVMSLIKINALAGAN
jgi:hypothetical protein